MSRLIAALGTAAVLSPRRLWSAPTSSRPTCRPAARRVMSALDAQTMFIAWSAPPAVYSKDVNYQYRQDSNLLYLTGVDQEGAVLVLMPGNDKAREVLFIREPEPRREQWTGHMLTKEEARASRASRPCTGPSQFEPFVGGHVQPGAVRPVIALERDARVRSLLRRSATGPREARPALRPPARAERAASRALRVRPGGAGSLHRRVAL